MLVQQALRHGPVQGHQFGFSPLPFVRPVPVWTYYVDGLLIDTGSRHTQQAVLKTYADYDIRQIALTHFHEDHAANAEALRTAHRCPVLAGKLTRQRIAERFKLLPYEHFWFGPIEPCRATLPLPDVVETERYQLHPVLTLGHSDDHYVFHEPNEGWLFAGDFYVGNLKVFRRGENIHQMIAATREVLTLDFDTLFCGHNPVLTGGRASVERKLAYLERIVEQSQDAAKRGLSEQQIVRAVGLRESWWLRAFTSNDVAAAYLVRSALNP